MLLAGNSTDGNKDYDDSDVSSVSEIDAGVDETSRQGDNSEADEATFGSEGNAALSTEIDFGMEKEVARKILENLIKSSLSTVNSEATDSVEKEKTVNSTSRELLAPEITLPTAKKRDTKHLEHTSEDVNEKDDDLDRTIFISNIPFEIDSQEVKQRFSVYGEVQTFVPVLHQLTK